MDNRQKKDLYLFTMSYPFDYGETFIENEISYLSDAFRKVVVIPLYCYSKVKHKRSMPDNCVVLSPIITSRWQHYFVGLFCWKAFKVFFCELIRNKVYIKLIWLKVFFIDFCTTNNLLQSIKLNKLLKDVTNDDVLYFYWSKGAANLLPFMSNISARKVVRFHNSDLYATRFYGYIPNRESIYREINKFVFISQHGKWFFLNNFPYYKINSYVSYLGTKDFGKSNSSKDGKIRILSCSRVVPEKRLFLLYNSLQLIDDLEIEWTHIGNGPDFDKLKSAAKISKKNVNIKLLGQLTNIEVLRYYKENNVDIFINVSMTEGLPVAIMEAISFNVPVIATDVGGTSEIVTEESGILLQSDPVTHEIVSAIFKIQKLELIPRLAWEKKFSAALNYPNFVNDILIN